MKVLATNSSVNINVLILIVNFRYTPANILRLHKSRFNRRHKIISNIFHYMNHIGDYFNGFSTDY